MTAKQNIVEFKTPNFLCGQFSDIIRCPMEDVITLLPEFGLFNPSLEEHIEYGLAACWFQYNPVIKLNKSNDNEWLQMERMICLDLCLLMLKDGYLDE